MFRQIIDDLRSGLSMKLLSMAMNVAPTRERVSLALAVRDHIQRLIAADDQSHPKPPA